MRKKKLAVSGILFCMAVCFLTPRLRAGGTCSATTTTPTTVLTLEEILSEFNPIQSLFLDGNFFMGDVPSQIGFTGAGITETPQEIDSGKKGPAAICDLPDTSEKAPVESNVESVLDHLQPFVLEGGPVSQKETRAVEKAKEKLQNALWESTFKWIKMFGECDKADEAAKKLSKAIDDAMNAEPDSEEAKDAAKRAEEAAEEAKEAKKEAEKWRKEAREADKKANKARQEYEEARERATSEAEKQNKAAQEAAEKAYEATGHGKANKK